jgi:hypothetical protein
MLVDPEPFQEDVQNNSRMEDAVPEVHEIPPLGGEEKNRR